MELPVVFQYQRALDDFRRAGEASPLLKRMSELISLLDLTTTLNSSLSAQEILEGALLIVMGELRVSRGALYVALPQGGFARRAARGVGSQAPEILALSVDEAASTLPAADVAPELAAAGLAVVCPVRKAARVIAVLALGPGPDGRPFGPDEAGFLRSVAACAATTIENGLVYDELRTLNQRLSLKVFQLDSLFEISRELGSTFDEAGIQNVVTTTLMGHLMVSRCGIWLAEANEMVLVHERGVRGGDELRRLALPGCVAALSRLKEPIAVTDLPEGELKARLSAARLALLVPLSSQTGVAGFVAVGRRASGDPFSAEDKDFAQTLGRQALAALEGVRLQHARVEQQRRDREMQIAREIQESLFPQGCPVMEGLEISAVTRPCYEVGGDYYDFIPLPGGRLALVLADVSGKGAPASILMASVHASVRAVAGTAPPAELLERLNRFLFASTQANKYVTFFYAELHPRTRKLRYVNAGHVPPCLLRRSGESFRLTEGGPVLGLLEDIRFEVGELQLEEGDTLAIVTDGVTEALSPADAEFGDVRLLEALRRRQGETAACTLDGLVADVLSWSADACSDDLTAMILKAL